MPNAQNYVSVMGTVTRKPDLRATPTGKVNAELLLAISRGFKREDGTDWIRVRCWQKTAELAAHYLDKGSRVQVMGRLRGDWYDSKDGKTRLGLEVVADQVQFLSRPRTAGFDDSGEAHQVPGRRSAA